MEKISYSHNSAQSYFDQNQNVPITASGENYGDIKPEEHSISLGTMPGIYESLLLLGDCNKCDIIKGIPSHNNTEPEVEGDFVNDKSELGVKEIRFEGNSSVNQVSSESNEAVPERDKCLDYRTMSDKLIPDCSSMFMQREPSLEMPFKASTNLVYSDSTNITTKSFSCPETDNWGDRREIEQIKFREIVNGKGRLSSIILARNDKKSNEDSELIEIPYKISLSDERGSLSVNVTDKKVLDYLKTIHVSNKDSSKDHLDLPESEDPDKWNKFLKPYKSYRFNNCGEQINNNYEKIVNDNLFSCKSLNDYSQLSNQQIHEDNYEKNNSISKDVHSMFDNDSSGSSAFESAISSNDTLPVLSLSRKSSKLSSASNATGRNVNLSTLTSENIPVAMSKMQTQQSDTEKIQPEPVSQDFEESRDNQDADSITSPRRYRSIIKLLNLTSHKKKNNQSCEFINKKREKQFDHPSFKKRLSSRLGSNHTDKLLIQDDTINTKSEIHENLKSPVHDGLISDKTGCETSNDSRTLDENHVTKKTKRKIQFLSKNGVPSYSQPNSYTLDQTKKFTSKIPRPVSKKESLSHEKNGKVIHKTTNQKSTDTKTLGLKTIDNVSKVNDKQEGRIKPKFSFKFGEHKNTSKEKPSSKNRKDNSWDLTNKTTFISDRLDAIPIPHETPRPSNCSDVRDQPAEYKSTLASKKCSRGIVSNSSIIRTKYWKKELKKNSYSFIETNMPGTLGSSVKQQATVKPDEHHSVKVYNRDYASTSYGTTYGKMHRVKTAPGRPNNKIYKKRSLDTSLHVPDLVLR